MMSWPAAAVISRQTGTGKKGWVMPHVCPFRPLIVGASLLFAWDSIWLIALVWTLVAPSCFSDVTPGTLPWWKVGLTLCSGIYRFTHCPKTEGLPTEVRNSDLKKASNVTERGRLWAQSPLERVSVNTFVCTGFASFFQWTQTESRGRRLRQNPKYTRLFVIQSLKLCLSLCTEPNLDGPTETDVDWWGSDRTIQSHDLQGDGFYDLSEQKRL